MVQIPNKTISINQQVFPKAVLKNSLASIQSTEIVTQD